MDSGKIILLRRGGNSAKVKIGEAWECLVEEKDHFCLATPVARHEEKILIAKQGNLFWQVRSGWVTIREELISDCDFISKPREFYITREMYAVVASEEYKLSDCDIEELSGNESFQRAVAEKTAIEEKERAEAEVRHAREKNERLLANLAKAKKTFSEIALSLKETGEFVFAGAVALRVETLSEQQFVAVAFDGRKLQVSRKGNYRPTGFTYRDDSDDMAWHTSVTTIKLGEEYRIDGLTTLPGFEGFLFETEEANRKRLEEERLKKKMAEAEIDQASAVRVERYNVYQGRGRDSYTLSCICKKNRSSFVYGTVDSEGKQDQHRMCDACLTKKARSLLEAAANNGKNSHR
ncbi:MAG: hypothetical protein U9R14_01745 [Patescibacteria group bacterium]|nr:hypothetical protein [Patescibacteria group bacterium]